MMSTGKLLIRPPELTMLPAESSGRKQEEQVKGMTNLACKVFLFILASNFYML
jgi:hypothetical protein